MPKRTCDCCSKVYSCRQSLFAHKKICQGVKPSEKNDLNMDDGTTPQYSQIPIQTLNETEREVENDDVESDEDLFQNLI